MSFAPDINDKRYSDTGAWVRYHLELLRKQREAGASQGKAQFGRFTGLPKDLSTMNEFGIENYLQRLGLTPARHRHVGEFDPDWKMGRNAEYDIFVPELGLAIEINPAWHKGGKSEIPRVAALDRAKEKSAARTGLKLVAIDPTERASTFAQAVNQQLVPYLREQGIHAPYWEEHLSTVQDKMARRLERRLRK